MLDDKREDPPVPSKDFERLKEFLLSQMRLSHVYQPLMIRTLLERGGTASRRDIAKALLAEDQSQLEYYEEITQRMPGPVHVSDFFDLYPAERNAIHDLLSKEREVTTRTYPEVEGFNVGVNAGATAGQTIFHVHVHLIPRRMGDAGSSLGGIRNVIPGRHLAVH
jgi:hypothetical protein